VSTTSDESVAAAKVLTLFGGGGDWVLCEGLVQEGRADPVKGIFSSSFFYLNQLPNKIQKYLSSDLYKLIVVFIQLDETNTTMVLNSPGVLGGVCLGFFWLSIRISQANKPNGGAVAIGFDRSQRLE
jgi:hypothetical protein